MKKPLILASASPRRLELLRQIGMEPDEVIPADIDETPHAGESPKAYVARMAQEKCTAIMREGATVLAADTVVACGRRILGKPQHAQEARKFLQLLSGRRHRVYTSVCVNGRCKTVMTQVKFKRLSEQDIADYLASGEWEGKAGGYAIQGRGGAFVPFINGSYSNVVGLPLTETSSLLTAS